MESTGSKSISLFLYPHVPNLQFRTERGVKGPSRSNTPDVNCITWTECVLSGRNSEFVCDYAGNLIASYYVSIKISAVTTAY